MNHPRGKPLKTHKQWIELCKKRRRTRDIKIYKFLSDIKKEGSDYQKFIQELPEDVTREKLLRMGIKELRQIVLKKIVKATDLVKVYLERALEVGLQIEALADVNIDRALEMAQEREDYLNKFTKEEIEEELDDDKNHGGSKDKKFGLLFGVPISIKDTYEMKDTYTTMGMAAYVENLNHKDGIMVKYLISEGAVIFVKTNIPMFLKTIESVNNIWGRAQNPWDTRRTPGGSSGGEAAIVACYCSPGGIGGDIGGSVRTPCAFTNLWGIKPSTRRSTYIGNGSVVPTETGIRIGQRCISAVAGPIARSADSAIRLFKTMNLEQVAFDDTLLDYKPWDEEMFSSKQKLRIGYVKSMSIFPACQAQQRAVDEAVEIATKLGHEVVKIEYNFDDFFWAFLSVIGHGDKVSELQYILRGEKHIKEYDLFYWRKRLPMFVLKLAGKILNKDTYRFNGIMNATGQEGIPELIKGYDYVESCRQSFHRHFTKLKLDALIFPSIGVPSLFHGDAVELFTAACYPMVFNVLDWPAVSVPITNVKKDEQFYECNFDDAITKLSKKTMKESEGLPISVQIATLQHQEEVICRLMKEFEPLVGHIEYPWEIKEFKKKNNSN